MSERARLIPLRGVFPYASCDGGGLAGRAGGMQPYPESFPVAGSDSDAADGVSSIRADY